MTTLQPAFEKRKFLSLPIKTRHKNAAEILRQVYENKLPLTAYRSLESWLTLPPVDSAPHALADRYHLHLKEASICINEHAYLKPVKRFDTLAENPYLPIGIYLEHLRSGHNVGSILRTTEAFRLGTVYFSEKTPGPENKKVHDAAMGVAPYVPTQTCLTLDELPSPLIALETVENAIPYYEFNFPKIFSLLLGNEEYGLTPETLQRADHVIQIPLVGSKNSLNVAAAFAIIAAEIRKQVSKDQL